MKKKTIFIICIILVIMGMAVFLPSEEATYDYLRLHIRANSNLDVDQNIKYEIKSELVNFLTPYLENIESKVEAIDTVRLLSDKIEILCNNILIAKRLSYRAKIQISNEYFPTRTYSNTTLQSGYYDAVIVNLGEADGDNWWCVMYPPLCFVNKNNITIQNIKYKSKIQEWLSWIFG